MKTTQVISAVSITALLVLSGCGGTSSGDDSSNGGSNSGDIIGTWEGKCGGIGGGGNVKTVINIESDSITYTDYTYSNGACSGDPVSNTAKVSSYTLGKQFSDSDNGMTIQQLSVSSSDGDFKTVIGASPDSKLVFFGDQGNDFPTQINLEDSFTKVGADLTPNGKTVRVLGHSGLDFSAGESGTESDAYTVIWSPTAVSETRGTAIWIGTFNEAGNDNYYVYDTGSTDLNSVSTEPTNWPQMDERAAKMTKNKVYVLKLKEGNHAKVKVLSTPDPAGYDWAFLIEYEIF